MWGTKALSVLQLCITINGLTFFFFPAGDKEEARKRGQKNRSRLGDLLQAPTALVLLLDSNRLQMVWEHTAYIWTILVKEHCVQFMQSCCPDSLKSWGHSNTGRLCAESRSQMLLSQSREDQVSDALSDVLSSCCYFWFKCFKLTLFDLQLNTKAYL